MNEYRFTISATCPVDHRGDNYQTTVLCKRTIPVEYLQAVVGRHTKQPIFQEKLTQDLARCLRARVTTEGDHSSIVVRSTWGRP